MRDSYRNSRKKASSRNFQPNRKKPLCALPMLSLIFFKTEGVKFVSTLPGDDILPIFDALHENGQVPLILTRHEQATVYIADGYARSTGEVGVAMVTKGPGPL